MKKFQVAFVGVNSLYGGTSALLLKQSPFIKCLKLYDGKNVDSALDISLINTQCKVKTYLGNERMEDAFEGADIIIVNDETNQFYDMDSHLITVCGNYKKYAKAISVASPEAIVVVSSSPVNCLLPMMSHLLAKNGCYDHNKVVGSTTIDTVRASALLASRLNLDPKEVVLPVVGGSSELTRVPLFSQARPLFSLNEGARKSLIQDIKRGENLVLASKGSPESMSRAHATVRFVNSILAGLRGDRAATDIAFCRTDLVPGVDYFSLPVTFGRQGVDNRFGLPSTTIDENRMIEEAVKNVKKDVDRAAFVVKETVDASSMKYLSPDDRASSQKEIFDLYVKSLAEPRNDDYSFKNIVDDNCPTSLSIPHVANPSPHFVPRFPSRNSREPHFFRSSNASFQTPIYTLEPLGCPSSPLTTFDNYDDVDEIVEFDREELLHENQMAKMNRKQSPHKIVDIDKFKRPVDDNWEKRQRLDPTTSTENKTTIFDNLVSDKFNKKPFGRPSKNTTSKSTTKSSQRDDKNLSSDSDETDKYKKLVSTLFEKLNGLGEGFYLPSRNHYDRFYKEKSKKFIENVVRTRCHSTSAVVPTKAPYKISNTYEKERTKLRGTNSTTESSKLICDKCRREISSKKEEKEKIDEPKTIVDLTTNENVVVKIDEGATKNEVRDEPKKTKKNKNSVVKSAFENEINSERLKRLKDKINEKLIPLMNDKKSTIDATLKTSSRQLTPSTVDNLSSIVPKSETKVEWKGVPFVVGSNVDGRKIDDKIVEKRSSTLKFLSNKSRLVNDKLPVCDENLTNSRLNEPKDDKSSIKNRSDEDSKQKDCVDKLSSQLFKDDSKRKQLSTLQFLANKRRLNDKSSTNSPKEEFLIDSRKEPADKNILTECRLHEPNDEKSTICRPVVPTEELSIKCRRKEPAAPKLSTVCQPNEPNDDKKSTICRSSLPNEELSITSQPPNDEESSTQSSSGVVTEFKTVLPVKLTSNVDIVKNETEKQGEFDEVKVQNKTSRELTENCNINDNSSTIRQKSCKINENSKKTTKLQLLSKVKEGKRINLAKKLSAAVKIAVKYRKSSPSNYKYEPSVASNIMEGFVFPSIKATTSRRRTNNLLKELSINERRIVDKIPKTSKTISKLCRRSPYKNVHLYSKTLSGEARETTTEYKNVERTAQLALKTILNRKPFCRSNVESKGTFDEFRRQLVETTTRKRKTKRNAMNVVEKKLRSGVESKTPPVKRSSGVRNELIEMPKVKHQPSKFESETGDVDQFAGLSDKIIKRIGGFSDKTNSAQLSEYGTEFVVPSLKDTRETFHLEESPVGE